MNRKKKILSMLVTSLIMGAIAILIMNDFSFIIGGLAIILLGITIAYLINTKEKM